MKSESIFFVHSSHKTKTWWMFLSVLLLTFVPLLIVWLLAGDFNLANTDWLIAKNQSVWHGIVTDKNFNFLIQRFGKFNEAGIPGLTLALTDYLNTGKSGSINSYTTFFNPIILAPLIGLFVWSIAYPIIFNATKVSGLDVLPFSVTVGTFMFIAMLTGLIDQWGQKLLAVYWLVRIVIAAIGAITIFLLANYFTNKYIASRPYATDIYFGYKTIDRENALAKEQLKDNLEIFKKNKSQDESYVEVEKEQ